MLFISGKYRWQNFEAVPLYLQILKKKELSQLQIIQVRSVELRRRLGFSAEQKYFSLEQLQNSQLLDLVEPLLGQENHSDEQKEILEAFHQLWTLKRIQSGQHFLTVLNYQTNLQSHSEVQFLNPDLEQSSNEFLIQLQDEKLAQAKNITETTKKMISDIRLQKIPVGLDANNQKLFAEVIFYKFQFFFLAGIGYLLTAILLSLKKKQSNLKTSDLYFIMPFIFLHLLGFVLRIWITGFAPVTNMYGTMIWVSLGIILFSMIFHFLYRNDFITIISFLTASFILLFTEQLPLALSPDLDPIVAVLRSNLWLTTHVLTITISYAAFTLAAVLGNIVIWKIIRKQSEDQLVSDFFHYAYRVVQLGCFLLTLGIILGGVWADYSWGRFWGWDPKETWALIADLGFLVLLHARFAGWLRPIQFLIWLPVSYLFVMMAWYGVNFILATGLHSYGFSSGGTQAILIFFCLQLVFFTLGFYYQQKNYSKQGAFK